MENQRDIIPKKTSKKNEEATPWADLPQEILGLILGKLLSAVDVIRFRAVCNNWDIPKDSMIKNEDYRNLPWLCNFSWAPQDDESYRLLCTTYDPYSHEMSKTITWTAVMKTRLCNNYYNKGKVFGYGSKQGWLIAAYYDNVIEKWFIFLYNPYTKGFFSFPDRITYAYKPGFASFSGNPVSQDLRFFVFYNCDEVGLQYFNHIYRYELSLNKDMSHRICLVSSLTEECTCCGMQYMNDQLFCLFRNGVMKRYSFQDICWTWLDKLVVDDNDRLWLANGDEDLLVAVRKDFDGNCSTFCFDWSNMRWVERDLPENSAIFISGDIATFVRPFGKNKDCNVYFFSELVCEKEEGV